MQNRTYVALTLVVVLSVSNISADNALKPPRWTVGQTWQVEVEVRQPQVAQPDKNRGDRWNFLVEAVDRFENRECFRISIRPVEQEHPKTTLWIDRADFMLRRIDTEISARDGYKTVSEVFRANHPTPVVAPLSNVPIALPNFPQDGIKNATETFEYNNNDFDGKKNVAGIGFTTTISQSVSKPTPEQMRKTDANPYFKSIGQPNVIGIELSTPDGVVRQLWDVSAPWPILTETAQATAKLLREDSTTLPDAETIREALPRPENRIDLHGTKSVDSSEGYEHGIAEVLPWSGYWWPLQQGGLIGPLKKYDRATGHAAVEWEKRNQKMGDNTPKWFGFCHAWAAASILEQEPRLRQTVSTGRERFSLTIGDQKGWTTACHTEDLAHSWGTRCDDPTDWTAYDDLSPDQLWELLSRYIGRYGKPIVLDIEPGPQVWNYPMYEYSIRYRPKNADLFEGAMTLYLVDDGVEPDFIGTKRIKQGYTFTFRMKDGNVVKGSGKWTGKSVDNHPDFAWLPYKAVAENPEIKHEKITKLLATAIPATEPIVPEEPAPASDATPVVLSPEELVELIGTRISSFFCDATVDRFDGAGYKPGETFFVRIACEKAGYLTLILVDPDGVPSVLESNLSLPKSIETSDQMIRIPLGAEPSTKQKDKPQMSAVYEVPEKKGVYRIKAFVTERPVQWSSLQMQRQQQQSQQKVRQVVLSRPFRLPPTQQRQVQTELLEQRKRDEGKMPERKTLELSPNPMSFLGAFAQDEVLFYVDAKATGDPM